VGGVWARSQASGEPTGHLKNAPDAIRTFHQLHPHAPGPLLRSKRGVMLRLGLTVGIGAKRVREVKGVGKVRGAWRLKVVRAVYLVLYTLAK